LRKAKVGRKLPCGFHRILGPFSSLGERQRLLHGSHPLLFLRDPHTTGLDLFSEHFRLPARIIHATLLDTRGTNLELHCKMKQMKKQRLNGGQFGLDHKEWQLLKSLATPAKVQDFLNSLPFNFEKGGETHTSVRETLKRGRAHCFEGALLAAAAFWVQGRRPLLLDLKTVRPDFDHVLALYQVDGYWGAVSKTNHSVLRYRDPIYKSVRELAMSYFHEYFLDDGRKTLRSFSKPFDLSKHGMDWLTSTENLADLAHKLDISPHQDILTPKQVRNLRKADEVELLATDVVEYKQ
jgi:hypothetical protein